ncbi:superoxide reductase [Geoalkalibacter ferrihydriticus]|uniref:Superoxide reductase n=1 Tax=Geoalkalibacter ferrihydriticus TaxID=392333 RepID=A0A1G9IUQ4_9BACT|nr:desulfoferrodoxin FeS4 iron-binding domain-containing protein [Geoalkalibacter ferrihydriticus]SDL29079.1 superoxide reductase [Geoalkalibacter ferrihydriticus]
MGNEGKKFKCEICGNVVQLLVDGGGELVCCGEPMEEMAE